jgi:hypothetical protein
MPGTSPGMTALGRSNLAHSGWGWQAALQIQIPVFTQGLRYCAAPLLNSPVERTNKVHDRLLPDVKDFDGGAGGARFRRCYFVVSRCYFAVSTAMRSMKKKRSKTMG